MNRSTMTKEEEKYTYIYYYIFSLLLILWITRGLLMFSVKSFFSFQDFEHKTLFQDIAYIWQALQKIEAFFKEKTLGNNEAKSCELAYLVNPEQISIGEGTIVEPGAYIRGPCIIGKNCQIRHGSYIRGNVIIGDYCVIGHATELKHSILLDHAHAAHFAFVGDSILGKGVNLGAGVRCANLRLDGAPVCVQYGEESFSTGMRKLGAIIGDETQIGCNVVLNPGTCFGKEVRCFPGLTVGGYISDRKYLRPKLKNNIIVDW